MNYSTAVKNARMAAVVTAIGATGVLEIGTAGMATVLAVIPLDAAVGVVSNGVLSFSGFPSQDSSADAAGVAAAARIKTSVAGSDVVTGLSVGLSGTDITLDSVNINAGQVVRINSMSITHA
jgi:hypothetical protein